MAYALAPSLDAFRDEVNARWPQRDKTSDGWIGDPAHAARTSDHNPGARDLVHAFDTDEDLDGKTGDAGADAWPIAEGLRLRRDPRIKYVIYEGRMFSSYATTTRHAWEWGPYSGENAHRKHVHLSILSTVAAENDTRPWLGAPPQEDPLAAFTEADLSRIVRTVLDTEAREVPGISSFSNLLTKLNANARDAALNTVDPAAIAAAVVAALPDGDVDSAVVEAAVRRVFADAGA